MSAPRLEAWQKWTREQEHCDDGGAVHFKANTTSTVTDELRLLQASLRLKWGVIDVKMEPAKQREALFAGFRRVEPISPHSNEAVSQASN